MAMRETLKRLEKVLNVHAPPLMRLFRPPASSKAIESVERRLGVSFPDDLRVFYEWHDGQIYDGVKVPYFFAQLAWCDLENVIVQWQMNMDNLRRLEPETGQQPDNDVEAHQTVRLDWWNPKWIPIGDSKAGAVNLCVDMDPGPAGVQGQLIFWCGDDVEHLVIATSLQSHLDDLILRLEQGKVVYSPERFAWVDTSNGKEVGSCGRWYQPY